MPASIASSFRGAFFSARRALQSSLPSAASLSMASAASRRLAGATTASTAPAFSASAADHCSPPAIHSIAVSAPQRRDRRTVPPQPGNRPSFVSGRPTAARLGDRAVARRQADLEAAADADAANRGDRGRLEVLEGGEHGVGLEDPARELGVASLEVGEELGDVGADTEDVLAARQQHAAQALARAQLLDGRLQRGECYGVELVDGLARQVEAQLGEAVLERQHLEGLAVVAHQCSSRGSEGGRQLHSSGRPNASIRDLTPICGGRSRLEDNRGRTVGR